MHLQFSTGQDQSCTLNCNCLKLSPKEEVKYRTSLQSASWRTLAHTHSLENEWNVHFYNTILLKFFRSGEEYDKQVAP